MYVVQLKNGENYNNCEGLLNFNPGGVQRITQIQAQKFQNKESLLEYMNDLGDGDGKSGYNVH